LGQLVWPVLKIGIHDGNRVSRGMLQPGADSHLVAKIPGQTKHFKARVCLIKTTEDGGGPVRTSVIHKDDFEGVSPGVGCFQETPLQLRQVILLVQYWDDDRNHSSPEGDKGRLNSLLLRAMHKRPERGNPLKFWQF
jgi:hypothetical protein